MRNNSTRVALEGDLPEGSAASGILSAVWKWTNWCGTSNVSAHVVSPGGEVTDLGDGRIPLPRCSNRAAPSVLTRLR